MSGINVPELLQRSTGFVRTLSPEVLASSRDGATLRLDAGPELHNHLGGPHAAVIFGLGETAAFAVLLEVFGDLVTAGAVPLVKSVEIAYSALATGALLAEAAMVSPEDGARTSYDERGSATFLVEVVFRRESDGEETTRGSYRMALKQGSVRPG